MFILCKHICTTDRPVVQITATTGGCDYVSVSWTTAGSSDVCRPVQYNVTLSSSMINMAAVVTSTNTHRFNGLPDDTQFTVTVIGFNVMGLASDPLSTSVVTVGVCESTCIAKCLTVCIYTYIANHCKPLIKCIFVLYLTCPRKPTVSALNILRNGNIQFIMTLLYLTAAT